ncbi:hypothetical protein C8J57DRAFT_1472004 [Mycena rebaudengoi]|nr:hypothetical protein C8J57DRAFT_1472004 [Mycena rebaudengoi]
MRRGEGGKERGEDGRSRDETKERGCSRRDSVAMAERRPPVWPVADQDSERRREEKDPGVAGDRATSVARCPKEHSTISAGAGPPATYTYQNPKAPLAPARAASPRPCGSDTEQAVKSLKEKKGMRDEDEGEREREDSVKRSERIHRERATEEDGTGSEARWGIGREEKGRGTSHRTQRNERQQADDCVAASWRPVTTPPAWSRVTPASRGGRAYMKWIGHPEVSVAWYARCTRPKVACPVKPVAARLASHRKGNQRNDEKKGGGGRRRGQGGSREECGGERRAGKPHHAETRRPQSLGTCLQLVSALVIGARGQPDRENVGCIPEHDIASASAERDGSATRRTSATMRQAATSYHVWSYEGRGIGNTELGTG